jgi:hypothetical protein
LLIKFGIEESGTSTIWSSYDAGLLAFSGGKIAITAARPFWSGGYYWFRRR